MRAISYGRAAIPLPDRRIRARLGKTYALEIPVKPKTVCCQGQEQPLAADGFFYGFVSVVRYVCAGSFQNFSINKPCLLQ